jgi:hypothetical protein
MNIQRILNYPYNYKNTIAPLTIMFLLFYGGFSKPALPIFILELFKLPIFRILILSLIVHKGNSNPTLSIMVAIGFVLVMDKLRKNETFNNTKKFLRKKKLFEKFADDTEEDVNCDNFLPMPGRTIANIEPRIDGTCKIHYFSLPGEKIDCSICQNEPDSNPNKEVADCNLITNQGICEYLYIDRIPDEVEAITEDQITKPLDENQILDELQNIFSDLENMKTINDNDINKINKIKIS